MIGFDRWQAWRGKRPTGRLPVHMGWLLALAYIGCLSHPALDWLNNYGIRLLEPFSHRWFYGASIFIIDLWIWIALGVSVWLSLRRERLAAADRQLPARSEEPTSELQSPIRISDGVVGLQRKNAHATRNTEQ